MNLTLSQSLLLLCFTATSFLINAQQEITVTESTIQLEANKEQVFYLGFAEGDKIIIDFKMKKGRALSGLEISELNGVTRYSDYEIKKIKKKAIEVSSTGIYKFKFSNQRFRNKICTVVIKRIPATNETEHFNTTVYWKTVHDTTYHEKSEKYLISKDTSAVNLVDEVAKVHSQTNMNGHTNTAKFKLPAHTVAYSYYIGVDQAGEQAYQKASDQLDQISSAVSLIMELDPITALGLGMTHFLPLMQKGEDINFYLTDYDNAYSFLHGSAFNSIRRGLLINGFGRVEPTPGYNGYYYVCLDNDNLGQGVTVMVKVVAIVVSENWGTRTIKVPVINNRTEAYLLN